jgi:pimeloyl-ACP methyl ester carboxylesterase
MFAVAIFTSFVTHAQNSTPDLVGSWQGTLPVGKGIRIVVQVTKFDASGAQALFYSIDQSPNGIPISSLTLRGSHIKFSISAIGGTYEGVVSADGGSIHGTWTQGQAPPLPLNLERATKNTAWSLDSSPHSVHFIAVDDNVKLEVLDWEGSGRPLVLLAGLGDTAHVFDRFAPKLTTTYHVYGITRRGFGASSVPAAVNGNYSADRLGDDVLAVLDALKINHPVLVGHSIAGEELSSVATRHPEKVAGLIYLEAGYPYAFYDRLRGDGTIDSIQLRKELEHLGQLLPGMLLPDQKPLIQKMLQTTLPQFGRDLQQQLTTAQVMPASMIPARMPPVASAVITGEQEYTDIPGPILAIFSVPHDLGPAFQNDPAARSALEAGDLARTGAQADAFEKGMPLARVVRLPHASHYVFLSNEADVLREMNAFLAKLP